MWGAAGDGLTFVHSTACTVSRANVWANGGHGVVLEASPDVAVGGCVAHNAQDGLHLAEPTDLEGRARLGDLEPAVATGVVAPVGAVFPVFSPRLPVGADTLHVIANGGAGVSLLGAGWPVELLGATIAGNVGAGVHIDGWQSNVRILDCGIGVRKSGPAAGAPDVALANERGVVVQATSGRVELGTKARGNVISGNTGDGVEISGSTAVTITGNFIGTDRTGDVALGNGAAGVLIGSAAAVRVGDANGGGNVISGNAGPGVRLAAGIGLPASTPSLVRGNTIGLNLLGQAALPNGEGGVLISDHNTVHLAPLVLSNLIAANAGAGVTALDSDGGVQIADNGIGITNPPAGGQVGLQPPIAGNALAAVLLVGSDGVKITGNTLGFGTGSGLEAIGSNAATVEHNLITGDGPGTAVVLAAGSSNCHVRHCTLEGGDVGVRVQGGTRNFINGNRIFDHDGKPIYLIAGGNNHIKAPTIYGAVKRKNGTWDIHGVVDGSVPNGSLVEVFADEQDEARIGLALASVVAGRWMVSRVPEPPPALLAPATQLSELKFTATVSDPNGNTSELGTQLDPGSLVPAGGACDLGGEPPSLPDGAFAGAVITKRDDGFAGTQVATGEPALLDDLAPGGGTPAICGARIAFSGGEPGAREIWLRDLDAGTTEALTQDPGDDVEPAFGAGCDTVVFASNREGSYDLFSVGIGGAALTALTSGPEQDREPAVSVNGSVAFSRTGGDSDGAALLSRAADGAIVTLADGAGDDGAPAWNAAGDQLVYTRCAGTCTLWLYDADFEASFMMGDPACDDRDPAWLVEDGASYVLVARAPLGPDAARHVVLLSGAGYVMWRVTPADQVDDAPACCLENAP